MKGDIVSLFQPASCSEAKRSPFRALRLIPTPAGRWLEEVCE